jgi:hypothetical protein
MAEETEAPPSFNRQLASLDVGGTVAVGRRILRSSPEAGDIGAIKNKMRQSINPAVSRARRKHSREFTADCGDFLTQDGHIVVTIAVTRTE